MATSAIAKTSSEGNWTQEQIATIRNTVAKGATPDELSMFLSLAKENGLSPFNKEIWFIKMDRGNPVIFTSRDGYLKIANNNPHFMGMDADVVYENDIYKKTEGKVEHTYTTKNRGVIVGAYAVVYRDDRKIPTYVFAPFRDYNSGRQQWKQYPHAMIQKVAEAMALKRAFSISGMVTKEEMDMEQAEPMKLERQEQPKAEAKAPKAEPINQRQALWLGYLEVCGNENHAKNAMLKITQGRGSAEWTGEDLIALAADLLERRKAIPTGEVTPAEPEPQDPQEAIEVEVMPESDVNGNNV